MSQYKEEDYDWALWYELESYCQEVTCKDIDWDKCPIPRHMINKYPKETKKTNQRKENKNETFKF